MALLIFFHYSITLFLSIGSLQPKPIASLLFRGFLSLNLRFYAACSKFLGIWLVILMIWMAVCVSWLAAAANTLEMGRQGSNPVD
ncbi:hypothetical protein RJT34_22492 [Clitoria ternatea]|uniref:Uncharacterized protein n=1 Tax=Clitoria ternatea TaxID=43366 RepID=A0AAN9IGC8_CLITE